MDTRKLVVLVLGIVAIAACGAPPSRAQSTLRNRVLTFSDADQLAFTTAHVDRGLPAEDDQHDSGFSYLARSRGSLVLPIIEGKIEQVLRSSNPRECFSDKDVDPQEFVRRAVSTIVYGDGEQALKETVKLLKLDEKRFGGMTESILSGLASANPFVLAYKGTDLGDPALNRGIGRYADSMFRRRTPDYPNSLERRWADVMVERYGGVPIPSEWASDPIVSNMTPAIAESMRRDMFDGGSGKRGHFGSEKGAS